MAEKDLWENPFRDEIFQYLLNHGYVESDKADYDYKHALDTRKLFDFLEATQSKELEKFKATYGGSYRQRYVDLLCKKIDDRGLLTALTPVVQNFTLPTSNPELKACLKVWSFTKRMFFLSEENSAMRTRRIPIVWIWPCFSMASRL